MYLIKIIGLPAIVSARHRIVIDKSLRKLCGIREDDTVLMLKEQNLLFLNPSSYSQSAEPKDISIGRFNLPMEWAIENHIKVGDCVYLIATTCGIAISPKNTDFMCLGEVCSE